MDLRTYRFSSTFTLEAPRNRVHDVLVDLEFYADWWSQVRAVRRDPDLLEVGIDGPIRGWARYHLDEQGPGSTSLRFEQEVRAEAPMFVVASYVARPLLVWNHHRMMRGSEQGLRARVQPSAATTAS